MNRPFDIVIWGATGFTGQLVARYMAGVEADLRWAIAGRNRSKLEALQSELGGNVPILEADSFDRASLDAMTSQTQVVCTTVGPYARYGTALVASCIANGTACCDLTGEVLWIRELIQQHEEQAQASGARIVNCAGFDSVPSDVGCFGLHQHFVGLGTTLKSAHMRILRARGGISGGTLESMSIVLDQARDKEVRRVLKNPYALYSKGTEAGPRYEEVFAPRKNPRTERWEAPFLMAAINTRLVRRTNALLGFPYGEGFGYDEAIDTGRGLAGRLKAAGVSAVLGAMTVGMAVPATRTVLVNTVLPKPGGGPSVESQRNGHFLGIFEGEAADGRRAQLEFEIHRDPGYSGAAQMMAETAIGLAETNGTGGILTPISALGAGLVDRLRASGIRIELRDA